MIEAATTITITLLSSKLKFTEEDCIYYPHHDALARPLAISLVEREKKKLGKKSSLCGSRRSFIQQLSLQRGETTAHMQHLVRLY